MLDLSGDLESCAADQPKAAAQMIRLAAEAGTVGGSIEDATGDTARPIYDFNLAVERIQAAVEMARQHCQPQHRSAHRAGQRAIAFRPKVRC